MNLSRIARRVELLLRSDLQRKSKKTDRQKKKKGGSFPARVIFLIRGAPGKTRRPPAGFSRYVRESPPLPPSRSTNQPAERHVSIHG